MTSLKPYLVRAIYDWIVDNNFTPYLLVNAESEGVRVPRSYVKDGKIILNLRPEAVQNLSLGNESVNFSARFGGTPNQVDIPMQAVLAIYAQENGKGMLFDDDSDDGGGPPPEDTTPAAPQAKKRPTLKVVK